MEEHIVFGLVHQRYEPGKPPTQLLGARALPHLLYDDEVQAAGGDTVFDTAETVLITDFVLAETAWTLAECKYRLAKAELVAVLERLFREPDVRFEDDQVVWRALLASVPRCRADGRCGLMFRGGTFSIARSPGASGAGWERTFS